jgi:hypothetical protein
VAPCLTHQGVPFQETKPRLQGHRQVSQTSVDVTFHREPCTAYMADAPWQGSPRQRDAPGPRPHVPPMTAPLARVHVHAN